MKTGSSDVSHFKNEIKKKKKKRMSEIFDLGPCFYLRPKNG